jgi:hypothetical protein
MRHRSLRFPVRREQIDRRWRLGPVPRSLLAGKQLRNMGYQNVISMAGGYTAWKNAGYPWHQDRQFTTEQLSRYSRHFLLPEVGTEPVFQSLHADPAYVELLHRIGLPQPK